MSITTLRDTIYFLFNFTFKNSISKCSQANSSYVFEKPSDETMVRRVLKIISNEFEKALEICFIWFFKGFDTRQDTLTFVVRTYHKEFIVKFRKYHLYGITWQAYKRNNFENIFRVNMRRFLEEDERIIERYAQK